MAFLPAPTLEPEKPIKHKFASHLVIRSLVLSGPSSRLGLEPNNTRNGFALVITVTALSGTVSRNKGLEKPITAV